MIEPGQHRLARIQIVNWGTFDGAFTLDIPREGLLITGPSGSGKSSLLDALAAVLVQPKWLSFNAAAQESGTGDRTRSLVSYVRGAYKREADEGTGEVATAYLRPGATWSGIVLTFDDGVGTRTSLIRLLHLPRGSNAASDLTWLFVLADDDADLLALAPFAADGLNARRLRAEHPTWASFSTYSTFAARLQRRLGLASDQAQRLLHKTQSAKNLTSLDTLLRDFMLDEPDTFELADQSVSQFQELSLAHASVVDARRQVDALSPLRLLASTLEECARRSSVLDLESEHLHGVVLEREISAGTEQAGSLRNRLKMLKVELGLADDQLRAAGQRRDAAQVVVTGLGGDRLRQLDSELQGAQLLLEAAQRARALADTQAATTGLVLPDLAEEFPRFLDAVAQAGEGLAESAERQAERYRLMGAAHAAADKVRDLQDQLSTLAKQHSNLDRRLLMVRDQLLEAAGVERERLSYVGELIDVRTEYEDWHAAIERVLRPFAQMLLVPEDAYPVVADVVNEHHLGTRLVYARVPLVTAVAETPTDSRSLVRRVQVAESEFSSWIRDQLVRRFDYPCVDSVSELRNLDRGVTRAGQVKHSRTRHEKDDRSRIDDRTIWVLGTSTALKREALKEALRLAEQASAQSAEHADASERAHEEAAHRVAALQQLARVEWSDIDVPTRSRAVTRLRTTIDAVRASSTGLAQAEQEVARSVAQVADANSTRDALLLRIGTCERDQSDLTSRVERWRTALASLPPVPEDVRVSLGARLDDVLTAAQPGTGAGTAEAEARRSIVAAQRETDAKAARARGAAERAMQTYKTGWPLAAQDWDIGVEYLPDYLKRLDDVESDGLPKFEERFFTLLQTQSQNNIGILANRLRNARREVRERVDPINTSLKLTEYAPGQHLHVRVDDKRLPEVTEFLATLSQIVGGTLGESMGQVETRGEAEERFTRMETLLARLASAQPVDQRWRQMCLDTRLQVRFMAEVRGADGRAVDYYTGAGGLSGGERQKLVVFCLAAALRYQLAREGASRPTYGLVVLDEAFDKTDPEFTRAGLEVFRQFGFQLLLATPLKMLQTLEDYVGGAAFVHNESGQGSQFDVLDFQHKHTKNEAKGPDAGNGLQDKGTQESLL